MLGQNRTSFIALVVAFSTTVPVSGLAQEAENTEEGSNARALEEVVVTGSRLGAVSGFNTPTPVTSVTGDDLKAVEPGNIQDALVEMPAMATSVPASSGGAGSFAGGDNANGQAFVNLRGMGVNRTLVLLNGMRLGGTNANGTVDLNTIPQALVRRVDVVTGGASASYGSDAVAGVVNFVLDTDYEGIKFDLSTGITDKSDGDQTHASLAWGRQFGRAHIIGAVDYYTQDGIGLGPTGRKWHDVPWGGWNVPGVGIVNARDARSGGAADGGNIRAVNGCSDDPATGAACDGLLNMMFVENGALTPFIDGVDLNGSNRQYAHGGSGSKKINGIGPERERASYFLHGEFDFSDDTSIWAQGSFLDTTTELEGQPIYVDRRHGLIAVEGNPYIPAEVAAIFAADPGTQSIEIERYFYDKDFGRAAVGHDDETYRVAAGIRGNQTSRWNWDAAVSSQKTDSFVYQIVQQNEQINLSADVVEVNGQVGCYSALVSGLRPDCVPMNIFGLDAASAAAGDYVFGQNWQYIKTDYNSAEVNLRGDLGDNFSLTGDPIGVAFGATWYKSTIQRWVDGNSGADVDTSALRSGYYDSWFGGRNYYAYGNPLPFPEGEVTVKEYFTELGVPLLRGAAAAEAMDLSLAARSTDYSQSGRVTSWKAGLNWSINDSWRLRMTQSRDIRAPNPTELFESGSTVNGTAELPSSDPAVYQYAAFGQTTERGNPFLGPEIADTFVAGIVWTPAGTDFQASVDYYTIDLEDAIQGVGAQTLVDLCYQGDQNACKNIKVNGNSITTTVGILETDVVDILNGPINIAKANTAGIDIEMLYRTELGAGDLSIRALANHLIDFDNNDSSSCDKQVGGIVGGGGCGTHPEWLAHMTVGYDSGNFGIRVVQRYIHSGKTDPNLVEGVDINRNRVPSVSYTNLRLSYELGSLLGGDSSSQVFFNITNLFDREPPPTSTGQRAWVVPTDYGLYDIHGLRYNLGLRAEF